MTEQIQTQSQIALVLPSISSHIYEAHFALEGTQNIYVNK